ncbi:TPA: type II toxin-antitoxin system RnlA family toxin [Pseudomonas aeruginosa]|uniref:type II toxin-antitoxin system RnlA family toxin n=1 Tax=Pseudomonas aeruginosa TaxID=287 RepID=UPI0015DA5243|nr:type II toxin-antitoxin system RnlA family toxin [Pseudomonas aeruginosa]HDQ4328767.1 type II toxin-antitoxin system RnlA family toxin [Pseudomonas aeruginosa]HEJ3435287.1 type II toxin-antitoxin system RnlA family toxin [Pseudomonas aeruginosa]HEJ6311062.1 type II toxin-antitoxin system RnlA family toxin [Pseudomonas aeruginosa]
MSDYKDLNLNREALDANIQSFLQSNGYTLDGSIQIQGNRKRVVFGAAGAEFATVDLHLNSTGTTTVQWKMGKNQPVGEQLAIYLKATINPAEFENVNYSLRGITADSFDPILDCLQESEDLEINTLRDEPACKQVTLKSIAHQDSLTLTHHRTTRVLQIQGKPLSCYRRVIFMLTDLLDLKGLEQVLYRKDDSSAEIVRKEMAEDYLKGFFPQSYIHLPDAVKKLLISSCCVKLAAPKLPDYCLLLYPDLRSLEGVLKELMSGYNMSVEDAANGFGDFFDVNNGICTLKPDCAAKVGHAKMQDAFNKGYSYYRKHRHTLFHMEEFADGSRMIDTLDKAISLSKDAYIAIDNLYTARM